MLNSTIVETAPAKINLTLDVLGKRADGFHEVATIMQTLDLADTLEISAVDAPLSVSIEGAALPDNEKNSAFRAAVVMAEAAGRAPAVNIRLIKRIPIAAGLAGGSADAAAVLRGLNRLWKLDWHRTKLEQIAARIGSDVVFCLRGGTALATGRGELVSSLRDCPPIPVVLVCPEQEVLTEWVYANYDKDKVTARPDTELAIQAISQGNAMLLSGCLCNVLESVIFEKFPYVLEIKKLLRDLGAHSLMSGSGPTVFALSASKEQADQLAARVKHVFNAKVWVSSMRRAETL